MRLKLWPQLVQFFVELPGGLRLLPQLLQPGVLQAVVLGAEQVAAHSPVRPFSSLDRTRPG